jgi:hypothetical protein
MLKQTMALKGATLVHRELLVRGTKHLLYLAVDASGDSPAAQMIAEMRAGMWKPDADHTGDWPDSAQPNDMSRFMSRLSRFSQSGVLEFRKQINRLDDGIWEFKYRTKRISFFDTDGLGTAFERPVNSDPSQCSRGATDPFWQVPDFERIIRLGHCFPKTGERTTKRDLRETKRIRKEDLAHDRAA